MNRGESLRQAAQQQAEEFLREAESLARLSPQDIETAEKLSIRHEDLAGHILEIAPWEFEEKVDERSPAARLYLKAGGFLINAHHFDEAIRCLRIARWLARLSPGAEYRIVESRAAGKIAYCYLTMSEIAASNDAGKESIQAFQDRAARYYELEAVLQKKHGEDLAAAEAFGNAGYRYGRSGNHPRSARAARAEGEIRIELGDSKNAAMAFAVEAEAWKSASEGNDGFLKDAVRAMIRSGRVLAGDSNQKEQAARALSEAGMWALGGGNFELADLEDALRTSAKLYEEIGDFRNADDSHYKLRRYQKKRYGVSRLRWIKPTFLVFCLLDLAWGYGARPWRLLPTSFSILVAFAAVYFVADDVRWTHELVGIARFLPKRMSACVGFSFASFIPAEVFLRIANLHLMPSQWSLSVGSVSLVAAYLEGAIGATIVWFAGKYLVRWFKRNFLYSPE